jgi:hypothetical protein
MQEKYIFGKHRMDLPGLNTLRILKKRQIYLIHKLQIMMEHNNDKNAHILDEIRALEKIMNFMEWVINNSSDDIVQGTIEKYMAAGKSDEEEAVDEEVEKGKGIFKGIFHADFSNKRKLEITITEYNKVNYIFLEQKRLKQDMITWKTTDKLIMSLHKIEKIIKRAYQIL